MTLSPEQFKEIFKDTLRDELENFVTKNEFNEKHNEVLTAVDGVSKKLDTIETELVSNQAAHNRIQEDMNEVRKHVGLDIKNPTLSPRPT